MEFRQLNMLLAVVECGGYSKAGERLRISHSAIHRQIRLLEEELGERLVARVGNQVRPTKGGVLLLEHARRIHRLLQQAQRRLGELKQLQAGELLAAGGSPTMKSALHFRRDETWSASGANASSTNDWPAWRSDHGPADPGVFPPEVVVQIKALACELSVTLGLPLFTPEHCRHRTRSTAQWHRRHHQQQQEVWRWLNEDAIRPWQHRCWIFPRDPNFAEKAGRILDLYERTRKGRRLKADEFVICTDEKNSIQARIRKHPSSPPAPGRAGWVEHEYGRGGAWAYLAALDVHRAKLFGRCEKTQL